jgi:hypothetical protein
MESSFTLFYYKETEKIYNSFKFMDKIYQIENESITIPIKNELFTSEPLITEIQLYNEKEHFYNIFNFNLYKGENIGNLFLDVNYSKIGRTYELIFREENINIEINKKEITHFDTLGNKYRKRCLLINFQKIFININNININFGIYIQFKANHKSFQFSFYNIEKKLIVVKKIKQNKKINLCFESNLLKTFLEDLKSFIINKGEDKKSIFKSIKLKYECLKEEECRKLNISKNKLIEQFNKEEYFQIYYIKRLINTFYNNLKQIEKDFSYIEKILNYFEEIKIKISSEKSLKIYQKIFLLEFYFSMLEKMNFEEFITMNIKYYIMDKAEKDSVFYYVIKFLNEFIEQLNESSYLFFPLLELNSGVGNYLQNKVYCFNMININTLKQHLKEIVPEFIITFSNKGKTIESIHKYNGVISINTQKIVNEDNIDFFMQKLIDIKQTKNYAIKIIRYLLHELSHKKFTFENQDKDYNSPLKFINKNNEIIELLNINSKKTGSNICKKLTSIINDFDDSGNFLEYYFGFIENENLMSLLIKCNDLSKLIDNPQLFTSNNLSVLQKYIKLKYLAQINNINYIFQENISILDEIKQFEELMKENNIKIEFIKEENFLNKKRKNDEIEAIKKKLDFNKKDNYMDKNEKKEDKDKKEDQEVEDKDEVEDEESDDNNEKQIGPLKIEEKLNNENLSPEEYLKYKKMLKQYVFTDWY